MTPDYYTPTLGETSTKRCLRPTVGRSVSPNSYDRRDSGSCSLKPIRPAKRPAVMHGWVGRLEGRHEDEIAAAICYNHRAKDNST